MRFNQLAVSIFFSAGIVFPACSQSPDHAPQAVEDITSQIDETLKDAVEAAYLRNPSILAQRKARMIADERFTQAQSSTLPQVSISSSAGYILNRTENLFGSNVVESDSQAPQTTFGLEVRQSLWSGGRNQAAIGEARAGVDAAASQLFSAEQQMILNVVATYMDVLTSLSEVEIRRNNVAVLLRQVQAAKDRFEVGEVTRTDVAQAQARHSGAIAQMASAQANLEANRALYQELVGRVPVNLADVPEAPEFPEALESVLETAKLSNPDLLSVKADVKAAEQRVEAAKAERRPNISVVGSAGLSQTFDDQTFENENASVVAQFSMPLYQGGLLSSRIRSASLQRDQLRLQYRAAERNLIAQVTRTWHAALSASRSIEASIKQVEAAEIAFNGAEQELAVGLRSTLDTLNQEQDLLNARLALLQARRNHYVAMYQLLAIMGQLTPAILGIDVEL